MLRSVLLREGGEWYFRLRALLSLLLLSLLMLLLQRLLLGVVDLFSVEIFSHRAAFDGRLYDNRRRLASRRIQTACGLPRST